MERFVESVRKNPCLWNPDIEEYKFGHVKEAAWRDIVQECELSDVKEAKILWRKLRDGHRQAVSRKKISKTVWKYEKIMEFLVPTMQHRTRSTNVNRQDFTSHESDVSQQNEGEDSSESEQDQNLDEYFPPTKTPKIESVLIEKEVEAQSMEGDSLRGPTLSMSGSEYTTPNTVQNAALEKFFTSMLLTTSNLPERLQIRVQRQVFNVVMEAQEEYIANRSN